MTYGEMLRRLINAEQYPYLWEVAVSDTFDDDEGYGEAEFGLQRVLDGIEALINSR